MTYVLLVVLAVSGNPVAFTQEFSSLKTCEHAAAKIKQSSSTTTYFAICTEK